MGEAAGIERWKGEVGKPTEGFFRAFGERKDARGATCEAMEILVPAVNWAGYLPHVPHGLLGTWAAWALRPRLGEASFRRLLATQLHAFAHEARDARNKLAQVGAGSGNWANIRAAVETRRPSLAWGECQGLAEPSREDFAQVLESAARDMACVGHKPVSAWALGELWGLLDAPPGLGRLLLGQAAWLAATEPVDVFWHQRASARLEGAGPIPRGPAQDEGSLGQALREVCDLGLVELLDRWCARLRLAPPSGELLSILALAAAEKQLDARGDLEGKTSWNWVFLAALAEGLAGEGDPRPYAQAAALVNFFPTDEAEDRVRPKAPRGGASDPALALEDAILDGEPPEAMFLAGRLREARGDEAVLGVLAEAASRNDPAFNYSHQALAVAAAGALLPHLTEAAKGATLEALAKSLANSQGSSDLGRLADRALASPTI